MITCLVNPSRQIHAWLRGQGINIRRNKFPIQISDIYVACNIKQEQTLYIISLKYILKGIYLLGSERNS